MKLHNVMMAFAYLLKMTKCHIADMALLLFICY